MKKLLCLMFVLSVMCQPVSAATKAGVVTVDVDMSAQEQGKEAQLWLPYPVSDADQTISGIKIAGDYTESAVYTDRQYGNAILYARWDGSAKTKKISLSFTAERTEITQKSFPDKEGAWNAADYAKYLAPTSLGPIDGDVKKLADKITAGKKTNIEKAKAIYDWTCENTYRDPNTKGCGKGDVCQLLQKPGGKCTDISSIFVALCRAAGVPAREIFGLRLGKKTGDDITAWQHCWAEFFVPGYGWIPADPADVRKAMLVENLKLEDQKTKDYRNYFWGGIDAYRIKLSSGRDIVLNPPQAGGPLNTFGYPYAEIGGKPLDFYDPKSFVYKITHRDK